jgi:Flp pilus assembly protein TadD
MGTLDQIQLKMQTAASLRWQDPDLAQVFARSALEDAQALGYLSASLHFQVADLLDDVGNHAQAFKEVTEALRLDPFHPGAMMLAANLARRLRAALRSGLRAVDDPAIPRLYALLADGGETTFSCHVTMIRYAIATGQLERAVSLAEAVATLYPEEAQAWSILAEATRAAGNEERAGQAEFHLGVLGLRPGLPPPRWEKA